MSGVIECEHFSNRFAVWLFKFKILFLKNLKKKTESKQIAFSPFYIFLFFYIFFLLTNWQKAICGRFSTVLASFISSLVLVNSIMSFSLIACV